MMPLLFLLHSLLIVPLSRPTQVAAASMARRDCQEKCGNLTIPYPFGTTRDCSRDDGFLLTCNTTFDPPRIFLDTPNSSQARQVTSLTLDSLTISYTQITQHCFPLHPGQDLFSADNFDLGDLPYTLSSDLNRLTVIGCDSTGVVELDDSAAITGCLSLCSNTSVIPNGTCSGEGCCQVPLKKGAKRLRIEVLSVLNHTTTGHISNCSVAFPVQKDWYNFSSADLANFTVTEVPVVLEWAIGNETCAEARGSEGFACVGGNATCVDLESGEGYRCHCMDGYEGNPYLREGCHDVDECAGDYHNCWKNSCINEPGSYRCSCPEGMDGDGWMNGTRCQNKHNPVKPKILVLVSGKGLALRNDRSLQTSCGHICKSRLEGIS